MKSEQRRARILLLMAGPKFDLEWEFGDRMRAMSEFSCGDLVTMSSASRDVTIGEFVVRSIKVGGKKGLVNRIGYLRRCIKLMRSAREARAAVEMIVAYDPMATGLIGLVLAKLFKVKLICEVNGDYTATVNYAHIRNRIYREFRRKLVITIARLVLQRADGIKLLFDTQLERLNVVPKETQIVSCFENFVNVRALRNLGEEPVVLLVGFPILVKGVDVAIKAYQRIEQQFPDWTLKIMGFYPDRRQLDELIGDSTQIFVQKPVRHRYVNDHIGRCGILLQPSRTEAMGRVLVEAMAAEKPVIASDIDGVPNVVDDRSTGLLVPVDSVEVTAAALERLMREPNLRSRYGKAGAMKVSSEVWGQKYFEKLKEFYGRVYDSRMVS